MIAFESIRGRRIVGRIEHGESLFNALASVVREHNIRSGWISATGAFVSAEFQSFDPTTRAYVNARPVDACDVVHLTGSVTEEGGNASFSLHAIVVRKENGQSVMAGGKLRAAVAQACEFFIECVDDLELERGWDSASGLSLWRAAANRRSVVPAGREAWATRPQTKTEAHDDDDAPMSWGVATASAERAVAAEKVVLSPRAARRAALTESSEPAFVPPPLPEKKRAVEPRSDEVVEADPIPVAGDYIAHRQFGLCRVDGEDDEGGIVIRLPSGIRKSIRLDVMRVLPAQLDGERRVFPVEPRRR